MEVNALDRNQLDKLIEQEHCLDGGTKQASIKVKNYLHNAMPIGSTIQAPGSCVRNDEFIEAAFILLAYVSDKEDVVPERWSCENDCAYPNTETCPGGLKIQKGCPKTCPFYVVEDK